MMASIAITALLVCRAVTATADTQSLPQDSQNADTGTAQVVFGSTGSQASHNAAAGPAQLHGRFIHLTDLHPDPWYKFNSSEAGACHSHDPAKGERAGYWGQPVSDCDSPITLINATFDWLEAHFKGKIDFVVWTGDNARHDIDTRYPRSLPEIVNLNRFIARRMRQTFGHVPVVTSIGNNDVFPHNIMFAGPSKITSELLSIWKHYIPEVHLHSFAGGGYYSVEAIPGHLLLVSLNTIYFFENNKAVDGCPSFSASAQGPISTSKKDEDPGTIELLWLEQQLLLARARGMQVWLTGHVPATKANWYDGCYRRYSQLALAYHDTIVGHLFGHLNVDHFTLLQAADASGHKKHKKHKGRSKKGKKDGKGKKGQAHVELTEDDEGSFSDSDNDFIEASDFARNRDALGSRPHIQGSVSALLSDLLDQYKALPTPQKAKVHDYSVVNVNPSVIPTYLPAFRVWEYNTSVETRWRQPQDWDTLLGSRPEAESDQTSSSGARPSLSVAERIRNALAVPRVSFGSAALAVQSWLESATTNDAWRAILKRRKKHKKKHPSYPPLTRHHNASSPSQRNSYLTPVGYTQYMLDLEHVNKFDGYGTDKARDAGGKRPLPEWQVEYTTLNANIVAHRLVRDRCADPDPVTSKSHQVWPPAVRQLVEQGAPVVEIAEALRREDMTPYEMDDLTFKSWLTLGHKLGKQDKQWKGYRKRMFVSSGADY
ncbi:Endopolyphosphatase [Microbotryomycetes sp. JL201]|nr:Endopolyphosphatase [Microbotryomycetes sp. JL201]